MVVLGFRVGVGFGAEGGTSDGVGGGGVGDRLPDLLDEQLDRQHLRGEGGSQDWSAARGMSAPSTCEEHAKVKARARCEAVLSLRAGVSVQPRTGMVLSLLGPRGRHACHELAKLLPDS